MTRGRKIIFGLTKNLTCSNLTKAEWICIENRTPNLEQKNKFHLTGNISQANLTYSIPEQFWPLTNQIITWLQSIFWPIFFSFGTILLQEFTTKNSYSGWLKKDTKKFIEELSLFGLKYFLKYTEKSLLERFLFFFLQNLVLDFYGFGYSLPPIFLKPSKTSKPKEVKSCIYLLLINISYLSGA